MSEPKGPYYIKKVRGISVWHIRHPQIVGWLEARESLADAKHASKNMNDSWLAGYAARGKHDQENESEEAMTNGDSVSQLPEIRR